MSEAPEDPNDIESNGAQESAPAPAVPARVRGRKRRAMKRGTRWILMLLASVIATVILVFFTIDIGRITIAGKSITTLAEGRASKYLERPMHIGGISAYITPGKFVLHDVVIEGPTPADRPFFTAKQITVDVPWWTMFRTELYIEIGLRDWRMVVEKFPDNKTHLPKLTSKDPNAKPFPLKIRGLAIYGHHGEFVYDDHVTPWSVTGPNLEFALVRANNLSTYVGSAAFTGGTVQIQKAEPMSADFRTRFQVDGGVVRLKHIDLLTDGAESHIYGFVDFKNWPNQEYNIQSTVDFSRMRELFWSKADWRISGQGDFKGVFKIFQKGGFDLSGLFSSEEAGLGIGNAEWRFPDLHGSLQWLPDRFVVPQADSDFLGGRLRLAYGLENVGTPGGANASLAGDYEEVDLYRFTRQFGFTALEPQGRMRGQVAMTWRNGAFGDTMEGRGATTFRAPAGRAVATETLPADAPEIAPEVDFLKFRPYGEFPLAGETAYRFTRSTLDFDPSWVTTPTTFVRFQGHARGGPANVPFHVTSHDWQNSDRLFAAIMSNFKHPMGAIEVGGRGTFDGVLTKAFDAPRIEGKFAADNMRAWGQVWGRATGDIAVENSYLTVANGLIAHPSGGRVSTSGRFSIGFPRDDGGEQIHATIRAEHMPLDPLLAAFQLKEWPIEGQLVLADLELNGEYLRPGGRGTLRIEHGTAWQEPFDVATGNLSFESDGSVRLRGIEVAKGPGKVTGDAWLNWEGGTFTVVAAGADIPVEQLQRFRMERVPLTGVIGFTARGDGTYDAPNWRIEARIPDLYAADEGIGAVRGQLSMANNVLSGEIVAGSEVSNRLQATCNGSVALDTQYDANLNCRFVQTSIDPYFKFVGRELPFTKAIATGAITVTGPLRDSTKLVVQARIDDASLTLFDYDLKNDGPIRLAFRNNAFQLESVKFTGVDTESLEFSGTVDTATRIANVKAAGQASLKVLQAFYPSLHAEGRAELQATLTGSFDNLELAGRAIISDGRLRPFGSTHSLSDINGPITMENGRISVTGLRAVIGEGPVDFGGAILLNGYRPEEFDLTAHGRSMHLRVPEGLQSTVEANLRLTGPIAAPLLSGTVDVLKAAYLLRFKPELGLFNVLGAGGNAGGGLVAPIDTEASTFPVALAIRVQAGTMPLVENKAANALISGSAEVDITGTIDHPIVTGHVDVDHGAWMFSGNRYKLVSGSVDFGNPLRFDPFFTMVAEARPHSLGQTYVVTVGISGTIDSLSITLSSDPWLPEFQIVSLLLGETPDIGAAELHARSDPQAQQTQALSTLTLALLASPVSSIVGSAVQRATTLTAQIVPLLYGNEANLQQLNPTARFILGSRISDRIYMTWSRTLSGAQNEVILVEYDQNDQISWVLSRNEDRSFALDFRLRYVFR